MDEPTLPVVACDAVTFGFVVVIEVEVVDVVAGAGSVDDAAGAVAVAVVAVGSLEAGAVDAVPDEEDVPEEPELLDEDEEELLDDDDDEDEDDEDEDEDEDEDAAAVSLAFSPLLEARCVAGADAAAITTGGVGTYRGAWRGSTCTVCPGRDTSVRSIPAASTDVTLCAPMSVWLKVSVPSRFTRMLPDPRMPTVARLVFIWNRLRSRLTMPPVKTRNVPVTRCSSARPASVPSVRNSYWSMRSCVPGRIATRAPSTITSWMLPSAP